MRIKKLGMMLAQGALLACLLMPALAFAQSGQPADTQTNTPTAANGVGQFVPLTHFPQIQELAQPTGFTGFVNTFYKILIGVGAVLAVIMIMVAGVQFMTSRGSVTSNEKAKSRIQNAILGLILILAPTIVFGIINPQILHIDIGNEFSGLKGNSINQGAFSSSPNPTLSAQQCSTVTNKALLPVPSGKTAASVCTAKGAGWASYDTQCCSSNDASQACCGYDPANIGTPTASSNPDNGSGNYYYDYVQQDANYDNGKACTTGVQSRRFDTSAACNSSAATAGSNTAIRNDCSSTETYSPSQQRFNQISALPTCPN